MSKLIIELVCSVIILASIAYYFKQTKLLLNDNWGAKVIANASQWTFTAFILGYALIIIWINVVGLRRGKFILAIFYHAAFVSIINFAGVWYYKKNLPKE